MLRTASGLMSGLLTLTLTAALTSSLRGDIALPSNMRYIDPIVRFEGVAKLSEYEFRLRYITYPAGPRRFPGPPELVQPIFVDGPNGAPAAPKPKVETKVEPRIEPKQRPATYKTIVDGKAFPLGAQRHLTKLQLLGLKREEFERRAEIDPSLNWLTDETPHVLVAVVPEPETQGKVNEPVPVTSYRVSLQDGKLLVERIVDEEKKAGVAPPSGTWIAGIALALAIAGSGLWLGRGVRFASLPWRRPVQGTN